MCSSLEGRKISGPLFTTTTEMKRGVLDLIPAGLRTLHIPDQPHRTRPRPHLAPGRPFLSLKSPVSGVIFTLPISPPASPPDSHWTSILGGLQAVTSAVGTGLPPSDHGSLTHTVTSPPTSQPDASILGSRMQSRLVEGGWLEGGSLGRSLEKDTGWQCASPRLHIGCSARVRLP